MIALHPHAWPDTTPPATVTETATETATKTVSETVTPDSPTETPAKSSTFPLIPVAVSAAVGGLLLLVALVVMVLICVCCCRRRRRAKTAAVDFSERRRKSGDSLEENRLYIRAREGVTEHDKSSSPVTATTKSATSGKTPLYLPSPASAVGHASSMPEVDKLASAAASPAQKGSNSLPRKTPLLPAGKKVVVKKPSPSVPVKPSPKIPPQGTGTEGQSPSGNGTLYMNVADKSKTKKLGAAVRWAKSKASKPVAMPKTTAPTQASSPTGNDDSDDSYEDVHGICEDKCEDEYEDVREFGTPQGSHLIRTGVKPSGQNESKDVGEDEYEDVHELGTLKGSHLIQTSAMPSRQNGTKEDDKEQYEELPLL